MKLKTKCIGIETGGPLVAILHKEALQELDIVPGQRVVIGSGKKKMVAVTDMAKGKKTIKFNEIGILTELAEKGKFKNGEKIEVKRAKRPRTVYTIREKLNGKELNKEEMFSIISDIIHNRLTEVEITYFVSACYKNGMSLNESSYLSQAIVEEGGSLKIESKIIVDKHCIGGVPSNRTTMVVVPIIAAAGLKIPKTSTRSITSVAGTADTMEVLAPIKHNKEKIKQIVKKTNGCMVWGGTLDLASADDLLIKFEKALSIDPEGILLASILSKKVSVSATHALIDIPIGPEAKIKTRAKAKELKSKFIKLGKKLNIKIKVILTDGSQPVGNGVGPALEARDVLTVLQNNGPEDLRKKSLLMASKIMQMAGIRRAKRKAKKILESGKAYEKMKEIIKVQGGNEHITPGQIRVGKYTTKIKAGKAGKITAINNKQLTRIGKLSGAPIDKKAGLYLYKKKNHLVEKGQILYTIYAENEEKRGWAAKLAREDSGFTIK